MFLARVVGTVWSTVKWEGLEGMKFLVVRPYHLADLSSDPDAPPTGAGDGVVVADILGAGVGEDVIVAYGHAGRMAVEPELAPNAKPTRPIDAAVVAIVDKYSVNVNRKNK